jgi:hypothetical protein
MSEWNIKLTSNFDSVAQQLPGVISRKIGYAALRTVNDMAFEIKQVIDTEMESVFHKPTPWTMKAIGVLKDLGKVREITPGSGPVKSLRTQYMSYVGLIQSMPDDDVWALIRQGSTNRSGYWGDKKYEKALAHQFGGNTIRRYKDMEGLLLKKGLIKPGYYAVPASGCPMDQYDNPQRGFIIQMLTYFDAMRDMGVRSNMGDKGRKRLNKRLGKKMGGAFSTEFFVSGGPQGLSPGTERIRGKGNPTTLPAGIWQRFNSTNNIVSGSFVQPVFLFVKATPYRRLIDVKTLATGLFTQRFGGVFTRHLLRAAANDKLSSNLAKYV